MDPAQVREVLSSHVALALAVARNAVDKMRPGGTLVFMGGTGGRRIDHRLGIVPAATAALAVHIMSNTALTGATYDIDGGQQFVR
jgi:thiamine pyrophosphokinase